MYGESPSHVWCRTFAHRRESIVDEKRPDHAANNYQQPASIVFHQALTSLLLDGINAYKNMEDMLKTVLFGVFSFS